MKVYLANPHSSCGSAGQNKASEGQSSRGARQILLTIGYFGVHFKQQQPQIDQYSRVRQCYVTGLFATTILMATML